MTHTRKTSRIARPIVRHSSGKWYCWHIADSFGGKLFHPTIRTEGMEKGSEHCKDVARKAAKEFNAAYVEADVHRPAMSEIKPSCERKNYAA